MEYKDFFEKIEKFRLKQEKQKQRGLNDFNLLSTVRKYHDEVYLHSTMMGALLNPKGLHYQHTLFLEKFLEIIQLDNFSFNLEDTLVHIEYNDIDLYLTDGNKHLIIENKIWAKDQPCQIMKYINIIKEEYDLSVDDNKIPKIDDIYVLYLTPNNKKYPYEHKVENGFISFDGEESKLDSCSGRTETKKLVPNGLKNYQVRYKKINYENNILDWLQSCQYEVQNITNLNEAIRQYIDIVKMVNNNYKEKVMSLSEALKTEDFFELAYEVNKEFPMACAKLECNFWEDLILKVKDIDGYVGIINKTNGEIQDSLDAKSILKIRSSNHKKSEVHLYFDIIKGRIRLLVGISNTRKFIYAVVHELTWKDIDKDDIYIKKIKKINNNFEYKKWCFGIVALDKKINLRSEKLIDAHKHIDDLAESIRDLVSKLKNI